MLLVDFLKEMEAIAPFAFQESYDNSGIQLGSPQMEITGALVCLDVTPAVIAEALQKKCNLVIAHHPLIFQGLKSITGKHYVEEVVIQAIKQDIAIVAMHTNLDNIARGVNHKLAECLGLGGQQILDPRKGLLRKLVTFCPLQHAEAVRNAIFRAGAGHIGNYDCCSYNVEGLGSFRAGEQATPFVGKIREVHFEPEVRIETIFPAHHENNLVAALKKSHPYEEVAYDIYPLENSLQQVGSGMIGFFEQPMVEQDFLLHVKKVLQVPNLRHSPLTGKRIQKVALCGGSGSFLLQKAMQAGAQAFITADIKYHQFFDAFPALVMVDAGHYETEQFTKDLLYEVVNKKISKFALFISKVNTNPVSYF